MEDEAAVRLEAKAWLRSLLASSGMSKAALARHFGVEPKTMYNAFSDEAGLPRGVVFYALLKELGAIQPDQAGPSIADRLLALEVQVQTSADATFDGLAAVQEGMQRIEAQLEALAARRSGRVKPA